MADNINISRDQLATFLKDPQSIRQFERLFKIINAIAPNITNVSNVVASSSDSKADLALSLLDRLTTALEMLALAPTQEPLNSDHYELHALIPDQEDIYIPPAALGSIASQNADRVKLTGGEITGLTTLGTNNVAFPATQVASSDPNTLDDYEEGTFTATLTGSVTPPTTPVTTTASYTKIGRQVTYHILFDNVDTTGAAGALEITGLPFSSAITSMGTSIKLNLGAAVDIPVISSATPTKIRMLDKTTTATTAITAGAGRYLYIQITTYV